MRRPLSPAGPIPVLTFLSNFLIGGTERQVVNLVKNHDRSRFEVHLACFRRSGPLLPEVENSDVALSEYPISTLPSLQTLVQQGRFVGYLRAHRIRVVHSFGFYANIFAIPAARIAGVALVVASIRDTGDHLTRAQKALQKSVCRAADHVLVNAQAIRDGLVDAGYDPKRISIIRNGIDVARFIDPPSNQNIRESLGLPTEAPLVAVFARLNRLKGLEYFLDAAALLLGQFESACFLIVGDSISNEYREELEERARALGLGKRIVFTGFRSDVPQLLAQVSISVLPSLAEGLSNVVLEAMAAGVPVVATAVGGTKELIDDGVSGFLVPPRDASALARAIGALLADPERGKRMGRAGREAATQRFSLQATVEQTERLYECRRA